MFKFWEFVIGLILPNTYTDILIIFVFLFFLESEGRSTLDTLPEGSQYKRVYPDWKPTIDKTDVVGAMEAIAGEFIIIIIRCFIIYKNHKVRNLLNDDLF